MVITRDEAFLNVCNIRTAISKDAETIGTGFFVCKGPKAYLATASHVSRTTNNSSIIIICDSNNIPKEIQLIQLNNTLDWIEHPIEDIAVMEIDLEKQVNRDLLKNRCFPYNQIEFNILNMSRDTETTSIGFPNGYGAKGSFFCPFTFRSHLSSSEITLNRFDTNTPANFICLENPSVGGYSGGPVFDLGIVNIQGFMSNSGVTRLFGITHGTICDNTGGKISAVTPALYLKDIIK